MQAYSFLFRPLQRRAIVSAVENRPEPSEMEAGIQPLDAVMASHNLVNHRLVEMSKVPLTHKVVAKARKGRRVTLRAQRKIVDALNLCAAREKPYSIEELFSYRGR